MAERLPESVRNLYVRMKRHHNQLEKEEKTPKQVTEQIVAALENRKYTGTLKALQDLWDRHADTMARHLEDHIANIRTRRVELHDFLMEMETPEREKFLQQVKESAHIRAVAYSRQNNNYTAALPKAIGAALVRMLNEKCKPQTPAPGRGIGAPRVTAILHGQVKLQAHRLTTRDISAALLKPEEYGITMEHAEILRNVIMPPGEPQTMRQLAQERGMSFNQLNQLINRILGTIRNISEQKRT